MSPYEIRLHGERDGVPFATAPRLIELRQPRLWKRLWRKLRHQPNVVSNPEAIAWRPEDLIEPATYTHATLQRVNDVPAAGDTETAE